MMNLLMVAFISISLIFMPFFSNLHASPASSKAVNAAKQISRINALQDLTEFEAKDSGRFEDVGFPKETKKRKKVNKLARKLHKKTKWSATLNPLMAIIGIASAVALPTSLILFPLVIPAGALGVASVYAIAEIFGTTGIVVVTAAGGIALATPPMIFILGASTHIQKKNLTKKLIEALQLGAMQSKEWKDEKWKKFPNGLTATKAKVDSKTDYIFIYSRYGQSMNIPTLLSTLDSYKGMELIKAFKLESKVEISDSDLARGDIDRILAMQEMESAKVYELNEVSSYTREHIADKPSLEFSQGVWVIEVQKK